MKFNVYKTSEKYKGGFEPNHKPAGVRDLIELATDIKSNQGLNKITNHYRSELLLKGKANVKDLKFRFPYITVPCLFTMRKNDNFIPDTWNGVVGFDIDISDNPGVSFEELFDKICTTPEVVLCFRSTSYGLKGLIRVDMEFSKDTIKEFTTKFVYPHFTELWKCKLDDAQAVLSQPMFINYDADVHCVPDAIPFKPLITAADSSKSGASGEVKWDLYLIEGQLRKLSTSSEGTIYNLMKSTTAAVAGFIKGGSLNITPKQALELLEKALRSNPHSKNKNNDVERLKSLFEGALTKDFITPVTPAMLNKKNGITQVMNAIYKDADSEFSCKDLPFVLIGDEFYEIINDDNNPHINSLQPRKSTTIDLNPLVRGFKDWKKQIRHYKGFVSKPSVFNFQNEIKSSDSKTGAELVYWNSFNAPPVKPQDIVAGQWKTIEGVVSHLFGESTLENDQRELFYDYMQTFVLQPERKLWGICLVSQERESGKSVLAKLFSYIFGENNIGRTNVDTIIDGHFNADYASKFIVDLDDLPKIKDPKFVSKLKPFITEPFVTVNDKNVKLYKIQNHMHFVITSNEVLDFMKVEGEENRFWIREVTKFPATKVDKNLYDKLKAEVPHFLHWLKHRTPVYKDVGRTRFDNSLLQTNAFKKSADYNKSDLYHIIQDAVIQFFENTPEEITGVIVRKQDVEKLLDEEGLKIKKKDIPVFMEKDLGVKENPTKITKWRPTIYGSNVVGDLVRGFTFEREKFLKGPHDLPSEINKNSIF